MKSSVPGQVYDRAVHFTEDKQAKQVQSNFDFQRKKFHKSMVVENK